VGWKIARGGGNISSWGDEIFPPPDDFVMGEILFCDTGTALCNHKKNCEGSMSSDSYESRLNEFFTFLTRNSLTRIHCFIVLTKQVGAVLFKLNANGNNRYRQNNEHVNKIKHEIKKLI